MIPSQAAAFFGQAAALGVGLGVLYGFLRPLGQKHRALADGVFCLGCLLAWVYGTFGLWQGDPGPWLLPGFFLGGILWEWGPGRLLRPVFRWFWAIIWKILGIPWTGAKKFWYFLKFLLFNWGKMGYNRGKKKPSP